MNTIKYAPIAILLISGCSSIPQNYSEGKQSLLAKIDQIQSAVTTTNSQGNASGGGGSFEQRLKHSIFNNLHTEGIRYSDLKIKETSIEGIYELDSPTTGYPVIYINKEFTHSKDALGWRKIYDNTLSDPVDSKESAELDRQFILSKIKPKDTIEYKFGTGKNKFILFSALDCGPSRRVQAFLASAKNNPKYNATIYIMPTTLKGKLSPAIGALNNIVCSKNPKAEWERSMTSTTYIVPPSNVLPNCDANSITKATDDFSSALLVKSYPRLFNGYMMTPNSNQVSTSPEMLDALMKI